MMKKIFSTIVFALFFLLLGKNLALAQTAKLEAKAVGNNITIYYTGQGSVTVQPIISESEINSIPANFAILPGLEPKLSVLPPTTWETKRTLDPGATYYVRVFDVLTKKFLTENATITIAPSDIHLLGATFEKISTGTYLLRGKINIEKHKETDTVPYSSIKISGEILIKETGESLFKLAPSVINKNGDYLFTIINNSFNPNTWYEARLSFDSELGASTKKAYSFTTGKGIVPETGKAADNFYDSNSYRLLAPIPGMTALLDPELCKLRQQTNPGEICDINAFLNFILSLIIGIAAVILVVRLIITGYGYMATDVPFVKAKLKGGFRDALLGLVFALASYVILNTINPRLVSNEFTIGTAEFGVKEYPKLDSATYQQITGKAILPKSQYVAMAQNIAKEYNIDACLLIATATAESNMNPAVFGSDADFALDIPSRRAFINSGIKYSGETFTKGDRGLILDKKFKNDTPKGKIDWRFSAGFGMLGVTFFPEPYFKPGYEKSVPYSIKDTVPEIDKVWPLNPKTGKKYTPTELLDAETSLRLGAFLLKKKLVQCKDPYTTMYSYNTGGCSSNSHGSSVRKNTYNQCKGIK